MEVRHGVWGKWNDNFEKDRESNVWCKIDEEKEDRGPKEMLGLKETVVQMVGECVEEGWWACFEKSIGVWSEAQEEVRTTKEDVEEASGEGEQECWLEEKGSHESSEMESGSWRDCCQ